MDEVREFLVRVGTLLQKGLAFRTTRFGKVADGVTQGVCNLDNAGVGSQPCPAACGRAGTESRLLIAPCHRIEHGAGRRRWDVPSPRSADLPPALTMLRTGQGDAGSLSLRPHSSPSSPSPSARSASGGEGLAGCMRRARWLPKLLRGSRSCAPRGAGTICPAVPIHPPGWGAASGAAAVCAGLLRRERSAQTVGSRSEKELNLFSSKPVFLFRTTSP